MNGDRNQESRRLPETPEAGHIDRREFFKRLGATAAALSLGAPLLTSCGEGEGNLAGEAASGPAATLTHVNHLLMSKLHRSANRCLLSIRGCPIPFGGVIIRASTRSPRSKAAYHSALRARSRFARRASLPRRSTPPARR